MERTYLIHVSLFGRSTRDRIAEAATGIKKLLSELSPDHKLAYTSGDGTSFGFLVKSGLAAHQIAWRIYSPGKEDAPIVPCPLRSDDQFLVLELGQEFSGVMNSTIGSWLRFHRPSPAAKSEAGRGESKGQSQLANQLGAIKGKIGKTDPK